MDKVLDSLKAANTCSICYEVFERPTTIQCSHTFCHLCLRQCSRKCPLCRQPFSTETRCSIVQANVEVYLAALPPAERQTELERRFKIAGRSLDKERVQDLIAKGVSTDSPFEAEGAPGKTLLDALATTHKLHTQEAGAKLADWLILNSAATNANTLQYLIGALACCHAWLHPLLNYLHWLASTPPEDVPYTPEEAWSGTVNGKPLLLALMEYSRSEALCMLALTSGAALDFPDPCSTPPYAVASKMRMHKLAMEFIDRGCMIKHTDAELIKQSYWHVNSKAWVDKFFADNAHRVIGQGSGSGSGSGTGHSTGTGSGAAGTEQNRKRKREEAPSTFLRRHAGSSDGDEVSSAEEGEQEEEEGEEEGDKENEDEDEDELASGDSSNGSGGMAGLLERSMMRLERARRGIGGNDSDSSEGSGEFD